MAGTAGISRWAGGAKRPIGYSLFVVSADGGSIFSEKPVQRSRLDVAANCPNPEPKNEHYTEDVMTADGSEPASSSVGATLDLLIHVVSFMHPDNTIYIVCIAFGPSIVARIRHNTNICSPTINI